MYGQPKTGISGWVYLALLGLAGIAWLGKRLKAFGTKMLNGK